MKTTVKTLMYLNEECAKLTKPIKFQEFKFKDGGHDFEPFFLKDKPNYNYESIVEKKKEAKALKILKDAEKGKVDEHAEGKLNRSVEELSMSDSDDEPAPAKTDKKDDAPKSATAKTEPKKEDATKREAENPKQDEKKGGWFSLW